MLFTSTDDISTTSIDLNHQGSWRSKIYSQNTVKAIVSVWRQLSQSYCYHVNTQWKQWEGIYLCICNILEFRGRHHIHQSIFVCITQRAISLMETRATLSVAAHAWHICFHLESVVWFKEQHNISSRLGFY